MIKNDGMINAPIRLCYYRLCHYNSVVDPFKPTIGVGLGLPGYSPGSADRSQMKQAVKNSEADLVETAMLEDKIRATDWEATNEAIEEQVARESYLQWLRDNERRAAGNSGKSATVTSADLRAAAAEVTSSPSRAKALKEEETKAARSSPKPGCSHATNEHLSSPKAGCSSQRDSPKPCSSSQPPSRTSELSSGDFKLLLSGNAEVNPKVNKYFHASLCKLLPFSPGLPMKYGLFFAGNDYGLGNGFALEETASFLNRLPPNMFGKFMK